MASCSGGPNYYRPSFVEMARRNRPTSGAQSTAANAGINPYEDAQAPLYFSDQLALNYANEMIKVLKPKFNRARIIRDGSETAQVAASGLVAGTAALKLSSQALSWLGIGGVLMPQVGGVFNAKGRSGAYLKAASEIENTVVEYLAHNQNPSATVLTQNGVTVVHRTTAAINVVEAFLSGQIPSNQEMRQMVEPMSTEGAVKTVAGKDGVYNNLGSDGQLPAPSKREDLAPNARSANTAKVASDIRRDQSRIMMWAWEKQASGKAEDIAALKAFLKAVDSGWTDTSLAPLDGPALYGNVSKAVEKAGDRQVLNGFLDKAGLAKVSQPAAAPAAPGALPPPSKRE